MRKRLEQLWRWLCVVILIVAACLGEDFGIKLVNTAQVNIENSNLQEREKEGKRPGKKENEVAFQEDYEEAAAYVSSSMVIEPPKIALTFDDGPNAIWTPMLLDGLEERGVKATFFLIGEKAERHPEVVKLLDEKGHLIGNHTYHHIEITRVTDEVAYEEIYAANDIIYSIIGKNIEYMRPPFGSWQRKLELEMDILPVMWTIDPLDWTTENVDEIVNKVVTQAEENDIILLHDCYESSVQAAFRIVDILKERGFEFVTVDELLMK